MRALNDGKSAFSVVQLDPHFFEYIRVIGNLDDDNFACKVPSKGMLTHLLTHSLTHSLTYSLTHLLTHSLTITHSLTHSLIQALESVTKFLDLSPASVERLECAFILAESPRAHRRIDDAAMTKEMAYIEPVACRMWALFGEFATRHNYKSWGNYNCTGYPPIQHKNVGPQGNSLALTYLLTH
jgi:hypothetical protein